MHAHVETSQAHTNSQLADPLVSGRAVTAVGTFAAGQSDQGSIHVAADAETGSFASGLSETAASVTASPPGVETPATCPPAATSAIER